jgi:hypothetical protein
MDRPQQQQRRLLQVTSCFDRVLENLQRNECKTFNLYDVVADRERRNQRVSQAEAIALSKALQSSTSVETFFANLVWCAPVQADSFGPFIAYIGSSPRLRKVEVFNSCFPSPEEWTPQLDCMFRAVRDNPSVKMLEANSLANPNVVLDLLPNTKSLVEFKTNCTCFTNEMARAIATGMSRNASIQKLVLHGLGGPLDIILAVLATSCVQSLDLWLLHAGSKVEADLWNALSNLLQSTPILRELIIEDRHFAYPQGGLGQIFLYLQHPKCCTSLEKLHLHWVSLALHNDYDP